MILEKLSLLDTSRQRKTLNSLALKHVKNSDFSEINPALVTAACRQYTLLLEELVDIEIPGAEKQKISNSDKRNTMMREASFKLSKMAIS